MNRSDARPPGAEPSRRIVLGGRHGYTVFVRPPLARSGPWDDFERRALEQGYLAVIDGEIIEPGNGNGQVESIQRVKP